MTESVVGAVLLPNAHMHREPPGTWNRQKLHWLLKYFGRKLADAKLQMEFTSEHLNINANFVETRRIYVIIMEVFVTDLTVSQWKLGKNLCTGLLGKWVKYNIL